MKVRNLIWLTLFEYISDNVEIHTDELTELIETVIAEYCKLHNQIIIEVNGELIFIGDEFEN